MPLSPDQATALKTWFARDDVPPEVKEQAKVRLREQLGATTPPPAPPAGVPMPRLAMSPEEAAAKAPEGGLARTVFEGFTNPTEVGGMVGSSLGTSVGLALAPETGGVSALVLPALGALFGGTGGREIGAAVEGRSRSTMERFVGAAVDALPALLGHALHSYAILSPEEVSTATRAITGEKAVVPKPALEPLPKKPGAAPAPPKAVGIPEVAPGVPAGALRPLPTPTAAPTVGPEFTRVARESLHAVEKQKSAHYAAELAQATKLGLETSTPPHIVRAAGDALEALDRSGLDPMVRDGARKVLESIRDVGGELNPTTGEVIVRAGKEPVTNVTYADLDAWRQKLQDYAPAFAKLGTPQTLSKGSVAHVLGLVDEEMARLAQGTPVESLHRTADEFFINEVQPSRALARSVLRGEIEPSAFVDTFTTAKHEMKFARYMKRLDESAPGTASTFRRMKYQNMIERATKNDVFNPDAFLGELDKMPPRTRDALLKGVPSNEIKELFTNIDQAKGYARTAQRDAQAAADAAHADAVAAHGAAQTDYNTAVMQRRGQKQAYTSALEHAKAQDPVLVSARRKLASQQMLVDAPGVVLIGSKAFTSALAGNLWPLVEWVGGGGFALKKLNMFLANPTVIPQVNRAFRLLGSGASPSAKARTAENILAHLVEGTGREILRTGMPGLPQPEPPPPSAP